MNNGFFTIQKGRDPLHFELLTAIPAHGELKNSVYNYSYTDKLPYGSGYYSISQTDNDGKTNFYKIIQVKVNINENFQGFHYVQQHYIFLKTSGAAPGNASLKLYSLDGKLMYSQSLLLTSGPSTYKINKVMPGGMYLLQLESQQVKLYNKKVIVY